MTSRPLDLTRLQDLYPDDQGRPSITVTVAGRLWERDETREGGTKIPRCCPMPAPGIYGTTQDATESRTLICCDNCGTILAVFRWPNES